MTPRERKQAEGIARQVVTLQHLADSILFQIQALLESGTVDAPLAKASPSAGDDDEAGSPPVFNRTIAPHVDDPRRPEDFTHERPTGLGAPPI